MLVVLRYGPRADLVNILNQTECVAEVNKLPLYSITSGELGTDVVQTDQKLRAIFVRANAWNSKFLLDEADIFLAKRDHADLERNGLVSSKLTLDSVDSYLS